MNIYQNTDFFKFLDLCGVIISNDTNLHGLIQDFNEFDKYRSMHIENSFEHNFIKWQFSRQKEYESNNTSQQPKTLQTDHTTTPIKLQTLKNTTPDIGDFINYTFSPQQQQPKESPTTSVTPYTFSPQHQPPIESPSKTAANDLVSQYLNNDIEVIDHNMLGTYMDEPPQKINTPPPGGKTLL
jgi:hypothetical protein